MAPETISFLPRILSVFYAQFDVQHGPYIVCQVPEDLIATSQSAAFVYSSVPVTPIDDSPISHNLSPCSNMNSRSPLDPSPSRTTSYPAASSPQRKFSTNKALFSFDDISKYVIPPSQLCGKLVRCHTQKHRILGLPVELKGKYIRNYFRYNLCFVFDRFVDSSCYEAIVRKISRVLATCEEESGFLSAPNSYHPIQMACEQMYEDLNTFAETSIPVDLFNSIELKTFPFFPNPPLIEDWMVPVPLIDLSKCIEANWDITMVKVCRLIDGVNHVSRIASLAECDLLLTREAISHLLFYQVVMTIDIFQFSNMYTLRRTIQWLADEPHVKDECGPYVVKPGRSIPDWPKLLYLYSRMKPGKTVFEWVKEHNVEELGIDVRRFASFGVIKGFLRRVHRWPVNNAQPPKGWRSDSQPLSTGSFPGDPTPPTRGRSQSTISNPNMATTPSPADSGPPPFPVIPDSTYRARKMSVAEKFLEHLRNRDSHRTALATASSSNMKVPPKSSSWLPYPHEERFPPASANSGAPPGRTASAEDLIPRRHTLMSPIHNFSNPLARNQSNNQHQVESTNLEAAPPTLLPLLNGEHHTDELSVKFHVGWPTLEQWLIQVGAGSGSDDYGRISMIFR